MAKYITDIGLEVHVELSTQSKMFCSCAVMDTTIAQPNTSVCPVCCGMPGTLPVINQKAVELAIRAAVALECEIAHTSIFARKNYFYPDLPKGYQISQYEYPLAVNGRLLINTSEGEKYIRIHRAHLEEDTGKLTHIDKNGKTYSLIDLNRAGVPLLEIVSEPDLHSVEDAIVYSRELRLLLRTVGISSGDMEKGTMRFEANISIRPEGSETLGTRVEVKNLNSFRAMENAITYQLQVQRDTFEKGLKVHQQTLGWNESTGKTFSQRSKENANDYRYFPEPDLPPLIIDDKWIAEVKTSLPELPNAKRSRYSNDYNLLTDDRERLVENNEIASFFEECIKFSAILSAKTIANWIFTDLLGWLNKEGKTFRELTITPLEFIALLELVENGIINQNTGKDILDEMLVSGKPASIIVEEKGLQQVSDSTSINKMIKKVIEKNSEEVKSYLNGKETIQNWLFGQVMKETKGKANPQIVKEILQNQLESLKK